MKYDLGPYTCPVTTASGDAQAWFDQGLMWTYGYNHEEAVTCFEAAAAAAGNDDAGGKMSRSKGAGGLAELIAKQGGERIRFFLLRTHYR
ncbi:MAG: hypothetical protein AAF441_29870, partial [Pseudomonadota bacterium]